MRFPRIQFSLRTLVLLMTASTIVSWWWFPGSGTQCLFSWGNDAGLFRLERLTSFQELLDYDRRTPDFAPGAASPTAPPEYVNFKTHDILVVPHSYTPRNLASYARLGGRLVVIRGDHPEVGTEGGVVIIPKSATVVFWPGNALVLVDIGVSCTAAALLLPIAYGHRRRRQLAHCSKRLANNCFRAS